MADIAPATTTTATSSAQGTPTAPKETAKPEAASTTAPAATSKPVAQPEAKTETKEPAKPEAEAKKAEGAEAKKPEAEAKKGEEQKPEAPKEVAYDIKLQEGWDVKPTEVDYVKAFSKENGYTNEQANALAAFVNDNRKRMRAMVDGQWLEECKNHPVHGKDKFPATAENIKRYLGDFPKLQALLDENGLANNPVVFDYLADRANRRQSDSLVSGKQSVQQDNRDARQRIADEYNKKMGVTR